MALTNVVVRRLPFHCATEVGTKPLAVTVRMKAGLPCGALRGAGVESRGREMMALTVKGNAFEMLPLGLAGASVNTVTCAVPTAARSLAGMAAVS